MDCAEDKPSEIRINPKFEPLIKEFVYKNSYWSAWSSLDIIKKIENDFEFFPDDTIVASYPRSGTTVLQQLVWLISNNVDVETATTKSLLYRFPFLDSSFKYNSPEYNFHGNVVDIAPELTRPRFFKTHLQYVNLEHHIENNPNMKVLIPIRNPKDNAVSMYHLYTGAYCFGPYKGTWDEFFERWIDGWIGGGDWMHVITDWWKARFRKNIKIIFYEDIISRKKDVIKEICDFLNKKLTDDQVNEVIKLSAFQAMKECPATNLGLLKETKCYFIDEFEFIRKGVVGDWKNYFSEEQSKRMDEKCKHVLDNLGLHLRYE